MKTSNAHLVSRIALLAMWLGVVAAAPEASAEEPGATPDHATVCQHVAGLSDARGGTATADEMAECEDAMTLLAAMCGNGWDSTARCIVGAETEDAATLCIEPCLQKAGEGGSPEPTPAPTPEIASACEGMVELTDGVGEQADCEASLRMAVESCPRVAGEMLACLEAAEDDDALGSCLAACAAAREAQ